MTTAEALRELADVLDLIDQLGAQLECAWIRHAELAAIVDESSTLMGYRRRKKLDDELEVAGRGLDKALDKALDKVTSSEPMYTSLATIVTSSAPEVHQVPVETPASAPKPVLTSQTTVAAETSHARAVLQLLASAGGRASTAYLVEAMVEQRKTTRQSIQVLLKQMANRGRLLRTDRGWYALPPVAKA